MNTINVKIVRVPGSVTEVTLNSPATVADALRAANVDVAAGENITLNGAAVDVGTSVSEGSRVILAKSAKGNS